jgi:hypothetical protein
MERNVTIPVAGTESSLNPRSVGDDYDNCPVANLMKSSLAILELLHTDWYCDAKRHILANFRYESVKNELSVHVQPWRHF